MRGMCPTATIIGSSPTSSSASTIKKYLITYSARSCAKKNSITRKGSQQSHLPLLQRRYQRLSPLLLTWGINIPLDDFRKRTHFLWNKLRQHRRSVWKKQNEGSIELRQFMWYHACRVADYPRGPQRVAEAKRGYLRAYLEDIDEWELRGLGD